MSKTVLDIQSVSRTYGKGNAKVYAINDISLSLKSGQFVLIVGSSGSGKSTLLNIMGMLDQPTSLNRSSASSRALSSFSAICRGSMTFSITVRSESKFEN